MYVLLEHYISYHRKICNSTSIPSDPDTRSCCNMAPSDKMAAGSISLRLDSFLIVQNLLNRRYSFIYLYKVFFIDCFSIILRIYFHEISNFTRYNIAVGISMTFT